MQEKIDYLKERIDNISSIIGEEEIIDPKSNKYSKGQENKFKTISDDISFIKMQMNDNSTVALDTLKKSKKLYKIKIFFFLIVKNITPLIDIEEYKNENIPSDSQMYNTLICNYSGINEFMNGVKYLKNNQKFLELNPLSNGEEKMKTLQSYELKTIDLESKMTKMSDNIDLLLENYNETVDIINKKFALYNQLLDNKK